MAEITFHRFADISAGRWLALLTHPEVRRHMPLAGEGWDEASAASWAAAKDGQWQENGYGPWAIRIGGSFAGWGGFQKEGEEVDLGLVMLPEFWGYGAAIFAQMLTRGRDMRLSPITILLPPSRTRMKGLARLGFTPAGELDYAGHRFLKFRLERWPD